jgi:hypothetical protein
VTPRRSGQRRNRSPRIVANVVLTNSSARCGKDAFGFTVPNGAISSCVDCYGTGGSPATMLV